MDNKNTRLCEILHNDGSWQNIEPINVEKGMCFRMFEPNGIRVIGDNDLDTWIADSDAYYNNDGIVTIDIYNM